MKQVIYSPEEKAAMTRKRAVGKITLRQYHFLVARGYDGEKIMRWTKHRASQEIDRVLK